MFNYNPIGIGIILRCKKSIICLKLTFYEIPHNFFFFGGGGGWVILRVWVSKWHPDALLARTICSRCKYVSLGLARGSSGVPHQRDGRSRTWGESLLCFPGNSISSGTMLGGWRRWNSLLCLHGASFDGCQASWGQMLLVLRPVKCRVILSLSLSLAE